VANFANLAFKALSFENETKYLKSETRVGSANAFFCTYSVSQKNIRDILAVTLESIVGFS